MNTTLKEVSRKEEVTKEVTLEGKKKQYVILYTRSTDTVSIGAGESSCGTILNRISLAGKELDELMDAIKMAKVMAADIKVEPNDKSYSDGR